MDDYHPDVEQAEPLSAEKAQALREVAHDPDAYLQAVNRLLAEQRQNAWPFEALMAHNEGKDKPGPMFMGAALVRTDDDRFYIASNIHHWASSAQRSCAEASAIQRAADDIPTQQLAIKELIFMGGMADMSAGQTIMQGHEGSVACPCGQCRDVISLVAKPDAEITCLPVNDGSMPLDRLREGTQHYTPDALLPTPKIKADRHDLVRALEWLQDSSASAKYHFTGDPIEELEGLEGEALTRAINERLQHVLKAELTAQTDEYLSPEQHLHHVDIAIVRTVDGQFFMGREVNDDVYPSTPNAVMHAVQNMGRSRISDVYLVQFDAQKANNPSWLERVTTQAQDNNVELPVPNGDIRQSAHKAREKWADTQEAGQGLRMHVFMPNDPQRFDAGKHVSTFQNREFFPGSFHGGKHWRAEQRAAGRA